MHKSLCSMITVTSLLFLAGTSLAVDSPLDDVRTNQTELATNIRPLFVDVFGESRGKRIDEGFVFIDGKYIEAPYCVTRSGLGIFINNIMGRKPVSWSTNSNDTVLSPQTPANLTKESSFEDIRGYLSSNYHFLALHRSGDDLVNEMIRSLRDLPCTRDVQKLDRFRVKLTLFSGGAETINMGLFGKGPKLPQDVESVRQRVDKEREHLENDLSAGACYFLFSDGGDVHFSTQDAVAQHLPRLVSILSATNSEPAKISQLRDAGFPYFTTEPYRTVMMKFAGSRQLEQRIETLVNGGKPDK